jgi:hypothetical protein
MKNIAWQIELVCDCLQEKKKTYIQLTRGKVAHSHHSLCGQTFFFSLFF